MSEVNVIEFRTMNTRNNALSAVLDPEEDDYEIALEGLEFAFSKRELKYIQEQHNDGIWFTDIAESIKRDDYEVLIAIMHMLRRGRQIKPLNLNRG